MALGTLAVCSMVGVAPANALQIVANLDQFTGSIAGGRITVTDISADVVEIMAEITEPTVNGDIEGVWFNLDPMPGSLSFVSGFQDKATSILTSPLGSNGCVRDGNNNLNGTGNPCPLNVLVKIGQTGAASGLISSTTFRITGGGLSLNSFGESFGMRLQSTGKNQNGSSKLGGTGTVIPTPAAVLPGLIGMGTAVFRKKKQGEQDLQEV